LGLNWFSFFFKKESAPKYTTPLEKYFVRVRITPHNHAGLKGVHRLPHFTKLPRDFDTFHQHGKVNTLFKKKKK